MTLPTQWTDADEQTTIREWSRAEPDWQEFYRPWAKENGYTIVSRGFYDIIQRDIYYISTSTDDRQAIITFTLGHNKTLTAELVEAKLDNKLIGIGPGHYAATCSELLAAYYAVHSEWRSALNKALYEHFIEPHGMNVSLVAFVELSDVVGDYATEGEVCRRLEVAQALADFLMKIAPKGD